MGEDRGEGAVITSPLTLALSPKGRGNLTKELSKLPFLSYTEWFESLAIEEK
jgi:hypothetical protein